MFKFKERKVFIDVNNELTLANMEYAIVASVLIVAMFASVKAGKLTTSASMTGGMIGFLIFVAVGWIGVAMMATFFMLGTSATAWKLRYKEQQGLAEVNKGRRKAGQVIANAGIPAILSILILVNPSGTELFSLMIAASFASATSDTLSSELGNVYGKKFYNVLSFKEDVRGLDGVISLEGTFCGILGSIIIAIMYAIGFKWNVDILRIIIAGTIGNLFDSVLGATVERKGYLNNDTVNFLNTAIAALIALLLAIIL